MMGYARDFRRSIGISIIKTYILWTKTLTIF